MNTRFFLIAAVLFAGLALASAFSATRVQVTESGIKYDTINSDEGTADLLRSASASSVAVPASPSAATPMIHKTEPISIYTSVAIARTGNGTSTDGIQFSSAIWDGPAISAKSYDMSGNQLWNETSFGAPYPQYSYSVAGSKHMDSAAAAAGSSSVFGGYFMNNKTSPETPFACGLFLHSTTQSIPVQYVKNCQTYLEGGARNLAISDDGKVAAALLFIATDNTNTHYNVELRVYDVESGTQKWTYTVPDGKTVGGVTISTFGEYISFVSGTVVYVFDTATGKLRDQPIDMGATVAAAICPKGVFLVFGYQVASVYKWNGTNYDLDHTHTNPGHIVVDMDMSVNGGGGVPFGCPLTIGWMRDDAMGVSVTASSLVSGDRFWTWNSPINTVDQNTIAAVRMHLDYAVVTTWGDSKGISPSILLFSVRESEPVFSFASPGSMFSGDLLVYPDQKVAFVTAAGKHVPANEMGNGGDFYVFKVAL